MHLAWKKSGDRLVSRSHDGTEVRIYPYLGRKDAFVVEGTFGTKTYCSRMRAPATMTRMQVIDALKESAEGHVLRFETTGIQDPKAAHAAIVLMNSLVWHRLLADWRNKNPTRAHGARTASPPDSVVAISETRRIYLRFQIDTNRINARQGEQYMNRLEEWRRRRVVEILMSETAADEAADGNDRARIRKMQGYVHTLNEVQTIAEGETRKRVAAAIFPGGLKRESDRKDVEIVVNAGKYSAILITRDGNSRKQPRGILGARNDLAKMGIRVVTDEEACGMVEDRIRARDERAREEAKLTGLPLQSWVGHDDLQAGFGVATTKTRPRTRS